MPRWPAVTRRRLRRSTIAVTMTAATVTPSMIVARALTAGVRPKRTAEYSTIGQVFVVPLAADDVTDELVVTTGQDVGEDRLPGAHSTA